MDKTQTIYKQYMTEQMIANEPWPEDIVLYQPFEAEQILLAENSSCLAVKCFLKMCKIPFEMKCRQNAEFMSPGGKVTKLPFIKAGQFVFAEYEPIVNFIEQKNEDYCLGKTLDEDEKFDMRTYLSLAEKIFTNAELFISFCDKQVYEEVTYPRYGVVYPWPLSIIQNMKKRSQVLKQLKVYQWKDITINEVVDRVKKCCEQLSIRLMEGTAKGGHFFYGEHPTELDALVFGHLYTILTTKLPNNILAETVKNFNKLVQFVNHIDSQYFWK